jgi:glycosyltransferase involved in cell wall biosynthesis
VSRIPTRHVRFLFVGRLQPYKGLHLLVRAFKEIEHRNGAKLTVYGTPGGYPDYYDTLLREMNDDPDISFRGQLPLGRLDRAFANTDYFVLPSLWHENSPLILVDAVQSQTPVIASAVGGVSDLVQDGFNGLLFPMGNLAALSEILQRAIQSPELSDQLRPGEAATLPLIDDYSRALINMLQARFQHIDTETRV